jgi:hypothetical protein
VRVKAWKPYRHVWDAADGSTRWRGGQINSLGATATIKLHAEANIVRTYSGVSNSLLPSGVIVGDAVMCRVTGSYPYTIAEIRASRFAPGAPSDQAGGVARGEFWPGIVPYELSNEKGYWWIGGEEQ